MGGYADDVGYRVRRDVYQRLLLKMVVWEGCGKWAEIEVDEVTVCHSIMVHTSSSHLLQLGLTQRKQPLTGFAPLPPQIPIQTVPGGYIWTIPGMNIKGVFATGDVQYKFKTFSV